MSDYRCGYSIVARIDRALSAAAHELGSILADGWLAMRALASRRWR